MSLERGEMSDDLGLRRSCPGFELQPLGDSEMLKNAGKRQDQGCNVGRSIQRREMDSDGDGLEEGM